MAKNKKGGVKKEKQVQSHSQNLKHSGSDTKNSQAQNGSQKKQDVQQVSGKQKGHAAPHPQNLKQRPPHVKKGTSKCFILSLILISVGVAGVAIVFSDDLQQGLDTALQHYVRPQVLALQKMLQLESEPETTEATHAESKREEDDDSDDVQGDEDGDVMKMEETGEEETPWSKPDAKEESVESAVRKAVETAADSVTHNDRKTDENVSSSHQSKGEEQEDEHLKERKEEREDNVIQKRVQKKEEAEAGKMKNEGGGVKLEEEANSWREEKKVLEEKPVMEGIKVTVKPSHGADEQNEDKAEVKTESPAVGTAERERGSVKDEEKRKKTVEDQRKMDDAESEKRKLEKKNDEEKNVQAAQKLQDEGEKVKSEPKKTKDANADSGRKEEKKTDDTRKEEEKIKKTMSSQTEEGGKDGKRDEKLEKVKEKSEKEKSKEDQEVERKMEKDDKKTEEKMKKDDKETEEKMKKDDKETEEKMKKGDKETEEKMKTEDKKIEEKKDERTLKKEEKKRDDSYEEAKVKEMTGEKKEKMKDEKKKEGKQGNLKEKKEEEKSSKETAAGEETKKDSKKTEGHKDKKSDKTAEKQEQGLTEKEDRGKSQTEKEVKKQTEEHKAKTSSNRETEDKTEANKERTPSRKEEREQERKKSEAQVTAEKVERKEELKIKVEPLSTTDGNVDIKTEGKQEDVKKEEVNEKENEKTGQKKAELKENKDGKEKLQKDETSRVEKEETRSKERMGEKEEKTEVGKGEGKEAEQKVAEEKRDHVEERTQSGEKKAVKDSPSEKLETGKTEKTDDTLETKENIKTAEKDIEKGSAKKKLTVAQQRALYDLSSISNDEDFLIREDLDEADLLLKTELYKEALAKYDAILTRYPQSPRALHGKGRTLDKLGFVYRSNEYLERAIDFLQRVMVIDNAPDELVKKNGRILAERQQFRGWGGQAVKTYKGMHNRFPDDIDIHNELGVSYLMVGLNARAKDMFKEVLQKDPDNGFAKVHLGFLLKTMELDYNLAVKYLSEGIASDKPGTSDGRFYLHLGDALIRLGRESEARHVYVQAESKGLFLSQWQRSLYNVPKLTGRYFWTPEETGYQEYIKLLEDNWKVIRDEGLAQLNSSTGSFKAEDENLRESGDWKQFTLFQQGRENKENCKKAPKTCALINRIPPARRCKRGQVKFSVMSPGLHVWPHVGPTNCRLRAHLGLVVPEGPLLRVVNTTRTWEEGKLFIFDDSFEHEVWHEGSELRLVLIVDFWHPELTEKQWERLSPI